MNEDTDYRLELVMIGVSDVDRDIAGFAFFKDPDGNNWAVQQMPSVR